MFFLLHVADGIVGIGVSFFFFLFNFICSQSICLLSWCGFCCCCCCCLLSSLYLYNLIDWMGKKIKNETKDEMALKACKYKHTRTHTNVDAHACRLWPALIGSWRMQHACREINNRSVCALLSRPKRWVLHSKSVWWFDDMCGFMLVAILKNFSFSYSFKSTISFFFSSLFRFLT